MTGIASGELAIQRRLTEQFIKADSLEIVLYRSTPVADGKGGYTHSAPAPLPAQTMRLIPLGDGATERLTANGQAVSPQYMLMGLYDADMQRFDSFTVGNDRYDVVFVNENRQYETKGEVYFRGQ
jgi:hypothetical protein